MQETLIVVVISQAGLFISKIVWDWLKERRNVSSPLEVKTSCPKEVLDVMADVGKMNAAAWGAINKVDRIDEILSKTDDSGLPLVYMPRSMGVDIKEMVGYLEKIERGLNGK
ncbi:MAG: hypothetical protein JSU85_09380 [Candidatus Zixiibacteriota bacterium]|nr:MAG: hypothetical protein JSU85_09380 [candidate division Zixibacteria bacterium]